MHQELSPVLRLRPVRRPRVGVAGQGVLLHLAGGLGGEPGGGAGRAARPARRDCNVGAGPLAAALRAAAGVERRDVPLAVDGEELPDLPLRRELALELLERDELDGDLLRLGLVDLVAVCLHYNLGAEFFEVDRGLKHDAKA